MPGVSAGGYGRRLSGSQPEGTEGACLAVSRRVWKEPVWQSAGGYGRRLSGMRRQSAGVQVGYRPIQIQLLLQSKADQHSYRQKWMLAECRQNQRTLLGQRGALYSSAK